MSNKKTESKKSTTAKETGAKDETVMLTKLSVKAILGRKPKIGDRIKLAGVVESTKDISTTYGDCKQFIGNFAGILEGTNKTFVSRKAYFPNILADNLKEGSSFKTVIIVQANDNSKTGYEFSAEIDSKDLNAVAMLAE